MPNRPHAPVPRDPFAQMILYFLVGASIIVASSNPGQQPGSLHLLLSPWQVDVWAWMLFAGAALAILGREWRGRRITALGFEFIGLIFIACTSLIYLLALLASQERKGVVAGAFTLGFGIAAIVRGEQVMKEKRLLLRNEKARKAAAPDG